LDALGRAPLHLCCVNPVPTKLLLRLLFVASDARLVSLSRFYIIFIATFLLLATIRLVFSSIV
jgi:hypothetical protein